MVKQAKLLSVVFLSLLVSLPLLAKAQPDNFSLYLPEFSGSIRPMLVWPQPVAVYQEILAMCKGNVTCNIRSLRQLGASLQALAFTRATTGLVRSYQQFNGLYYLVAWLPYPSPHQVTYIGSNSGELLVVDDWLSAQNDRPLANKEQYLADKNNPVFATTQVTAKAQIPPVPSMTAGGDQRLTFNYALVDKCQGIDGYVAVGFDFDKDGKFLTATYLAIKPHDPGYPLPIMDECPPSALSKVSEAK